MSNYYCSIQNISAKSKILSSKSSFPVGYLVAETTRENEELKIFSDFGYLMSYANADRFDRKNTKFIIKQKKICKENILFQVIDLFVF